MTTNPGFFTKTVVVSDRHFLLKILNFDNGSFVSITEGSDKLGAMVVSLASGPNPVTTTVIPARTESLFLKITAEKISTTVKGIAVVSAFVKKELEAKTVKALLTEITEMVKNV